MSTAPTPRPTMLSGAAEVCDILVIGGGVQGACLYHELSRLGYRTLLADRSDFGSGTSQASAMLIWGGLLYLKNLDVLEVMRLSASRDRMLRDYPERACPHRLSFVFGEQRHRGYWAVRTGLWVYWMLGLGRRSVPISTRFFPERPFLKSSTASECLRFEEGQIQLSDARFVYDWIGAAADGSMAANYCEVVGGAYDTSAKLWRIQMKDSLSGAEAEVRARIVINTAGVWADGVNTRFGITTPVRHALGKGVSFTFCRPAGHVDTLVFDGRAAAEGMSLVPWGPVSLWGSTETPVASADEGWTATREDLDFLMEHLNEHLAVPLERREIVALRCGVRPLVVPVGAKPGNPLELSKRWRICEDADRPWISVFGGKLTACSTIAGRVAAICGRRIRPTRTPVTGPRAIQAQYTQFNGMEVPSPAWCREHQMCRTLPDYLRRRTNIAQWVPRGGLGRMGEHRTQLRQMAAELCGEEQADAAVLAYERDICRNHDPMVGQ